MSTNVYKFTADDILNLNNKQVATKTTEKSKESMLEDLLNVEKKYGYTAPEKTPDLGLEKIEYNAPTDEELAERASKELAASKLAAENSINKSTEKKKADYDEYKENEIKSAEEIKSSIDEQYAQRKSEAEKEALKRGLARSSIIMNKIEEFDQGKIDAATKVDAGLSERLNKIDFNIAALETEREQALSEFDTKYAADITKRIADLQKERQNNINEALKYNNTITEKEAKHTADTIAKEQKAQAEYIENKAKYDKLITEEKMQIVKSYYDSLPAEEALNDFLADGTMRNALKEYYDFLLVYLKAKARK